MIKFTLPGLVRSELTLNFARERLDNVRLLLYSEQRPDEDDTPPDDPPAPNDSWHGQKRSNETHQSTTDEQARLFRKSKGTGAMLCYMGHVLTGNRHGLVVNAQVTLATGTAERDAAGQMLADAGSVAPRAITVGADKNYDTAGFVGRCRANRVTPHVAQNARRPGVRQLTSELRVGQVMRSASKNVSVLSRCSDGARQSDEFDK